MLGEGCWLAANPKLILPWCLATCCRDDCARQPMLVCAWQPMLVSGCECCCSICLATGLVEEKNCSVARASLAVVVALDSQIAWAIRHLGTTTRGLAATTRWLAAMRLAGSLAAMRLAATTRWLAGGKAPGWRQPLDH